MRSIYDTSRVLAILICTLVLTLVGCGDGDSGNKDADIPQASVVEVFPQWDEQEVVVTSLIVVHFSRPLLPGEVEQFAVGLYLNGNLMPARKTLLPDGESLVLDPGHDLEPASLYELRGRQRLPGSGNAMEEDKLLTRFTTSDTNHGGPEFQFNPTDTTRLIPYPTDLFTAIDASSPTGLMVRIPHGLVPPNISTEELDSMDGFSPYPRIILPLSSLPDMEALLHDAEGTESPLSPIFLIDLGDARNRRIPLSIELDPYGPYQVRPSFCLKITPLIPLDTSGKYALVVTRRIASPTGAPAEPSPSFQRICQGDSLNGLEEAYRIIRPVLEFLASPERDLPLDMQDLALVVPFTTRSISNLAGELVEIRDYLSQRCPSMPPRTTIKLVTIPNPRSREPAEHVALYVKGTVDSPDFRNEEGVFDPWLVRDRPEDAPLIPIEFILSIPKGAKHAPSPVVIFLHGINDHKELLYEFADELASYNLAAIAIDVAEHGARATSLIPWIPFLRVDALQCGRDNMRQTQVDLMNLSWAVRTSLAEYDFFSWGDGGGWLKLDTEKIFFIGNSLGSILAPAYLALDDAVLGAVLFTGGGNMTEVVSRYEGIQPGTGGFDFITFLLGIVQGYPVADIFYGMLGLGQEILDEADSLTYAPFVIKADLPGSYRPKDVLLIEVVEDQTLANVANENLSRALGLELIMPSKHDVPGTKALKPPVCGNGPRGLTAGLIQFDELTLDGVKVAASHDNIIEGKEPMQAACMFFKSLAETGKAVITDTRP